MATDNSTDEKVDEPELQEAPPLAINNSNDMDVEVQDEQEPVVGQNGYRIEDKAIDLVTKTVDSQVGSPSGEVKVKSPDHQSRFSFPAGTSSSHDDKMKESAAAEPDYDEPPPSPTQEIHDGQTLGVLSPVPAPPPLPKVGRRGSAKKSPQKQSENFQRLVQTLQKVGRRSTEGGGDESPMVRDNGDNESVNVHVGKKAV